MIDGAFASMIMLLLQLGLVQIYPIESVLSS